MMDFTPKKTSDTVFSNNTSRTSIHGILDGELQTFTPLIVEKYSIFLKLSKTVRVAVIGYR